MRNRSDEDAAIEVEAPSVSEATQKGLIQLGVTRDDVRIEVLNEGSRGIFGIGAEPARVRLKLRRPPARPVAPEEPLVEVEEPAAEPEAEPATERPVEAPTQAETEPEPEPRPDVDASEIALTTVRTLIEKIGVAADVAFRQRGEGTSKQPVIIDVTGNDLDVLIGQQGATLQALQFITRLIVSRHTHEWTNIVIDVDGYREQREADLRELAKKMAGHVRETGRPVSLEPMPPNERRVIHLELQDASGVTTRSVGEGDSRKVTIRPQR
jgi:spoIIIJ-associated protein